MTSDQFSNLSTSSVLACDFISRDDLFQLGDQKMWFLPWLLDFVRKLF